jgi:hypothetical protein
MLVVYIINYILILFLIFWTCKYKKKRVAKYALELGSQKDFSRKIKKKGKEKERYIVATPFHDGKQSKLM